MLKIIITVYYRVSLPVVTALEN